MALGVPYFNWGPAYVKAVKAAMAGTCGVPLRMERPGLEEHQRPRHSAVGFNKGRRSVADASAAVDKFIGELAGGSEPLEGPAGPAGRHRVSGERPGGHRPADLVPAPAPAGHGRPERFQVVRTLYQESRGARRHRSRPSCFQRTHMQIELRDIHKTFGTVHANAGISLTVPPATIQGILGENGAGKSTLMKILSGFILPTAARSLSTANRSSSTLRRMPSGGHRDAPPGPAGFPSHETARQLHPGPGRGPVPGSAKAARRVSRAGRPVRLRPRSRTARSTP